MVSAAASESTGKKKQAPLVSYMCVSDESDNEEACEILMEIESKKESQQRQQQPKQEVTEESRAQNQATRIRSSTTSSTSGSTHETGTASSDAAATAKTIEVMDSLDDELVDLEDGEVRDGNSGKTQCPILVDDEEEVEEVGKIDESTVLSALMADAASIAGRLEAKPPAEGNQNICVQAASATSTQEADQTDSRSKRAGRNKKNQVWLVFCFFKTWVYVSMLFSLSS